MKILTRTLSFNIDSYQPWRGEVRFRKNWYSLPEKATIGGFTQEEAELSLMQIVKKLLGSDWTTVWTVKGI